MFASKAAVIGTGFIGPVHIEGLVRAGVHVRGVLGSSLAKSTRMAEAFGLERPYSTIDELLADSDVTVVHITSPNRLHFEQVMACLRAGKHVFCEKPLAMNSRETAQLVAAAQESKLVCGVNYNIRFYPLCIEARERIHAGSLGSIYHINGSYTQDWLLKDSDYNWRVRKEEGGPLRALADIGTHWLDLAQSVSGHQVEALCADLKTVLPNRLVPSGDTHTFSSGAFPSSPTLTGDDTVAYSGSVAVDTEDYGALLLRFRGGPVGTLFVSQVMAGRKNCLQLEIACERGSLAWNSQDPNELWLGYRDRPNELLHRDPSLLSDPASRFCTYPGGHSEGFPDTFKQIFRSFYECVEGKLQKENTFPTFEDGHREILLCEAILQSAQERKWVEL